MINKIKANIFTEELKRQITNESFAVGCVISQLAKEYGISAKTIYNWRKERLCPKNCVNFKIGYI